MKIRKAEKKDIPRILELLGQVLQIHAEIRPDIFIPGTTKYTLCRRVDGILKQEDKPVYVTVDGTICAWAMPSVSSGNSPFPPTWCPLNHCLLMTCALTSRHEGSTLGKVCLNM